MLLLLRPRLLLEGDIVKVSCHTHNVTVAIRMYETKLMIVYRRGIIGPYGPTHINFGILTVLPVAAYRCMAFLTLSIQATP